MDRNELGRVAYEAMWLGILGPETWDEQAEEVRVNYYRIGEAVAAAVRAGPPAEGVPVAAEYVAALIRLARARDAIDSPRQTMLTRDQVSALFDESEEALAAVRAHPAWQREEG